MVMSETESDALARAQAALEARRATLAADQRPAVPIAALLASVTPQAAAAAASPRAWACGGECGAFVLNRGTWCASCAVLSAQRSRRSMIARIEARLTSNGALGWCRIGDPAYVAATEKARAIAAAQAEPERTEALELIAGAKWSRRRGNLLLLGPTGIGKTRILVAIGLRILDSAVERGDADLVAFAARIAWTTGLDLAEARSRHKLGGGEPPEILRAKRASLLLLDEIGFESRRLDPDAVRDVIYARYHACLPTIVASGRTARELEDPRLGYGQAALRRLIEPGRGRLVDLHPASGGAL